MRVLWGLTLSDSTAELASYWEQRERAFVQVRGSAFATDVLALIAADWPDLTVAELDRAIRLVHETQRARRRIQKGAAHLQ